MKKTIKTVRRILTLLVAAGIVMLAVSTGAADQVSVADFNALKDMVQKLNDQVQGLKQTNTVVQQQHEQDVQQLKELQAKLAETQQTAIAADQKSTAAAQAATARGPIDEATVNRNFQMLGDVEFQYANVDKQHGSFMLADFAPIFLYRGGENILFEAGFDTTLANNAPGGGGYTTTFGLSFAQLDYVVNDYLTACVGDLVLPLGTYSERGAGWLNKFPDNPLAVDALIPGSGVGAELRGAVALGDNGKFINYAVYGVNGPGSADGTANAGALDLGGNVGLRSDGVTANLHSAPAGGARLGVFLPLPYKPHYDLELGISGMAGEWDNAGNHLWSAGVLDAALHLGPNFELRGEYILTRFGSDDNGLVRQQGAFVQAAYKLAGLNLNLPVISDTELVGRYDYLSDGLGAITKRYTAGFIYYITNTLLFEGDYEFLRSTDPTANQLILQLSYGF